MIIKYVVSEKKKNLSSKNLLKVLLIMRTRKLMLMKLQLLVGVVRQGNVIVLAAAPRILGGNPCFRPTTFPTACLVLKMSLVTEYYNKKPLGLRSK